VLNLQWIRDLIREVIREIYPVGFPTLDKHHVDFPRNYQPSRRIGEQAILLATGTESEIASGRNTCAAAHHTVRCVTCVVPDPSRGALLSRTSSLVARASQRSDVKCSASLGKWSLKLVRHCGGSVTSHLHREILRRDRTPFQSDNANRSRERFQDYRSLMNKHERMERKNTK